MSLDIESLSLEEKCSLIKKIISSVLKDVQDDAQKLHKHCLNLDTLKEYVDSTSPEEEFEQGHPIVKTIINTFGPNCDVYTKVKSMEQLYFVSSVSDTLTQKHTRPHTHTHTPTHTHTHTHT